MASTPEYARAWWAANKERVNLERRLKRHGLTPEEFEKLWRQQEGCCAICGDPLAYGKGGFHVDHDHQSGKVRGLLCWKCNTGLGIFGDSVEGLLIALRYLENAA